MEYVYTRPFQKQLALLHQEGGIPRKIALKFKQAAFTTDRNTDPIKDNLSRTKHGESRLNCQKFALSDDYRLVTQINYKKRTFLFIGKHSATDKFLDGRKITLAVDQNDELISIIKLNKLPDKKEVSQNYNLETDYADTKLLSRLENKNHYDFVLSDIKPSILSKIIEMDTITSDEEILSCIEEIEDEKKKEFLFDVLLELRLGNLKEVKRRILFEMGEIREYQGEDFIKVKSGEDMVILEVGSEKYQNWMNNFLKNSEHLEWLLFTHSKQQEIIDEDFDGASLLNGVAGSGKTCIVVHRAIRHAKTKPKNKILVLTLNRSLASLILKLIDEACPSNLRKYIQVKSFFELCQDYIETFEKGVVNKYYSDVTWKSEEHIDDIWKEYFRCELNNDDAKVMLSIQKHFNEKSIIGEKYLKDEIDWIRSRFPKEDRDNYLTAQRKGRVYPILPEWRKNILKGLDGWEQKMRDVGVIDYIGLSAKLMDSFSELKPDFSHILVDEVQDFGQLELLIIRKLVKKGKNDVFMVGDENQKASVKFRSFNSAGINLHSSRKKVITTNYRNSREILKAAYEVFEKNFKKDFIETDEDFQILKPDYANFSSAKPKLVRGESLEDEVSSAINYLKELLSDQDNKNACLSVVGFTLTELKDYCEKYHGEFTLLDGSIKNIKLFDENKIFLSDLEQMKGYEFDFVAILNCSEDIIPNRHYTEEENSALLRLLYISMTRAKQLLLLSYSKNASKYLDLEKSFIDFSTWKELKEDIERVQNDYDSPKMKDELKYLAGFGELTGLELLYTEKARGLSIDLQDRLEKYVSGRNLTRDGNLIEWANISSAISDLRIGNDPGRQLFGQGKVGWKEFHEHFEIFD